MSEVQKTGLNNYIFTRDSKVDYKQGDPLINSVFKQYDKDLSGDFNDEEWQVYEKAQAKNKERQEKFSNIKINDKVVSHYDKKLIETYKKLEKCGEEFEKIEYNAHDNLLDFIYSHELNIQGFIDKKEIPKGSITFDAEALEMGILDEKTGNFSGKTYKKAYIAGVENLTADERKQLEQLLKCDLENAKSASELDKKANKLKAEADKYLALKDMAESGMIDRVGSEEFENTAYQSYQSIRSESNPFYKDIKDIEQKQMVLRLKRQKTEEDLIQIQQYDIKKQQLQVASENWSIRDADGAKLDAENGFMLSDLSENVSTSVSENNASITDEHSFGMQYNDENFGLNVSFTKGEKYTVEPDFKFENTYNANLDLKYKRGAFAAGGTTTFFGDDSMRSLSQGVNVGYKTFNASATETITWIQNEGEWKPGFTTQADVSYASPHTLSRLSGQFTESGNTYTASFAGRNLNVNAGKVSFDFTPGASYSFNDSKAVRSHTVAPSLDMAIRYMNDGFSTSLSLNENYSATILPQMVNHQSTFTATYSAGYKGFNGRINYTENFAENKNTHRIGTVLSYRTKKAGTFGAGYSYQFPQGEQAGTHTAYVKYSAPLDWSKVKKK